MDIADSAALASFVALIEHRFGRIDLCVTNFGAPPSNVYLSTAPEAWRAAADQLLRSTIHAVKKTSPRIQKRDWGGLTTFISPAVAQTVDDGLVRSLF
jgi:NAD(P)-dependent dehydrogenase (short-subunit alcohol dehydrogenase family)